MSREPKRLAQTLAVVICAIAAVLIGACGGGATIGEVCSTNGDCATGLSCIQQNDFDPSIQPNGGCKKGQKFCSVTCQTDADCTKAVGAGHICIGAGTTPTDCAPGICFSGSHT